MLSKSFIQFSVDGQGCVPSLLFDLRPWTAACQASQFSVDGQGCVPSLLFDLRPWTAACQASLSLTNSQSLLKLMSIESVIPSNHLILCHLLLLVPSILGGLEGLEPNPSLHQGLFK